MMSERPCEELEKTCAEAWEKWQTRSLRRTNEGDVLKIINLQHQYDDLAGQLRDCYTEHEVPREEERWPSVRD
jgi:hypothetical protein